ncbi:phosphatidylinositol mannoside acyltransferase [Ornithinicoccus hortensis]|uniref:KDO2-lipid IV(A) lauroyltransferase n=1 Tax=Ornithinicoccus hortensis TaxID=82346 RepID=A0A542YT98_9MICO|nr:phosphatidylinositol mannoside acyltransferase [Ornithinicoccus hortensis]TQL51319.1 KDO2-lipid IV(A) lauroyltransferase [Ornithinicoccus hortensis]
MTLADPVAAARSVAGRASEVASLASFRVGWRAVRVLPAGAAYRLFDGIAAAVYRRQGKDVQRMRDNYRRVRPDLDDAALEALVRSGVASYFRYWCESFRLPDRTADELARTVRVEGDGPVREALARGRGGVCFLGHLGNWDTAGAWATHHLAPVTTVAERLRPEELYDEFVRYREALGMRILPLTGGAPPFRELVRTVRDGGFVPLLADRDLTDSGLTVTFCGHPARMAAGPASLALATGAPLYPVATYYEPDPSPRPGAGGHQLVIAFGAPLTPREPEAPRAEQVQDLTQQCADYLTGAVRAHTEDWHMMQRVFVADGPSAGDGPAPATGAAP